MNKVDMEVYHQMGDTYVVPTEIMNLLLDENESLNKGIDELIKNYEEEKELIWHDIMRNKKDTPTYNSLSGELTQVNQILEDLKKRCDNLCLK